MPTKKRSKTSRKRNKSTASLRLGSSYRVMLILVVLVCALVAYSVVQAIGTTGTNLPDSAVRYGADASGYVEIKELGIAAKVNPELAQQGLVGVYSEGVSSNMPYKRIAFTTEQLASESEACDGVQGWLGVMTRYEGTAAAMGEHHHAHGSTNLDYPGFHINYMTPLYQGPCTTKSPGYSPDKLTKETIAARQLWDAMRTAKPLE